MNYISTRDNGCQKTSSQAILQGISTEGGLFVPGEFPQLTTKELMRLCRLDYCARAEEILKKYLTDFTESEIHACVDAAYSGTRFENDLPAPLSKISQEGYVLELWHGPTCAFKDMALQLLPHLLRTSAKKNEARGEIVILTATSGDTGKAALEGFRDAPGIRIFVFYPQHGVSDMQKRQMQAQEGENVQVCAIQGNFDDAQSAVKQIFTSEALKNRLASADMRFSSANSINFGRLLPQVVYYISAYCDLVRDEEIAFGDEINFVVPTGNFGNILAAYYAKQMGLPIGRLICASNRNNVLSDFIHCGVYDKNRGFYPSLSPSMDILVSSNLERLLFELSGRDAAKVAALMGELESAGRYEITPGMKALLQRDFAAGYCDDEGTRAAIRATFEKYGYLLDTHTAVAFSVWETYKKESGDERKTVVVSTASAYKFADSVCEALGVKHGPGLFDALDALEQAANETAPAPLGALRGRAVRFEESCAKEKIGSYICGKLGL